MVEPTAGNAYQSECRGKKRKFHQIYRLPALVILFCVFENRLSVPNSGLSSVREAGMSVDVGIV